MDRKTALILFALVWIPLTSWAKEKSPILIKNSKSPDGRKDIVIVEDDENAGVAAGTAKIRDVKTKKILGTFQWGGFGVHPDAEAFDVLWRPDSRCFAINWELTRGFVACAVYLQTEKRWVEVKLPDFGPLSLELAHAAGPERVIIRNDWGGKGHEKAAWLPHNRLKIDTAYRGLETESEDSQGFRFTLRIVGAAGTQPTVVVESARLAPIR